MHPDTITARERHAYGQRSFDRYDEEARLLEEIATDLLEALGPADPRTLHAQVNLAARYVEGNHDLAAAIDLGEQIIDEVRRRLGPDHNDLGLVRAVLMNAGLRMPFSRCHRGLAPRLRALRREAIDLQRLEVTCSTSVDAVGRRL
ncbi:hypothetical protein [Actinoplanes philippinensis]|uniref:hypothetical protein n=1 Tax=Actinoplanes philippinensis TaxID=35752 RepID=UPI0033E7EE03